MNFCGILVRAAWADKKQVSNCTEDSQPRAKCWAVPHCRRPPDKRIPHLGAGPGGVLLELDQLALETAEEILCHSVIVEYALLGSIGLHPLPESDCGVLDALATVKDEPFGRFAVVYRHV